MNANKARLKQMRHNAARKEKNASMRQHYREVGIHLHPQNCGKKVLA